jgi:hypothetical protein
MATRYERIGSVARVSIGPILPTRVDRAASEADLLAHNELVLRIVAPHATLVPRTARTMITFAFTHATPRRLRHACIALACALLAPGLGAQSSSTSPLITTILRDDGVAVPTNPSSRRNGFNLFAEEDLAGTSLRLTGTYRYAFINAGGLCPFANTAGDIFNSQCGAFGGSTFFHNTPVWGIGLDDYAKIRAVWPNVANMRAPVGFSTPWRITSIAPITTRINAADGQFGQFYAGVTSLTGAGCREFTGAAGAGLPENFTLLASSDCPETWPGTGFGGLRQLPDSVWLQRFQANPAAFRWDDWKVPANQYSSTPIGNITSYGAFSDYPREILQLYGGVTPRGTAGEPPGERGFPLGIYVRADAWKFDRPSLRNGVFVRWLVVNNSEQVWGAPIDYDKLYMGVDPGYTISGQSPAAHNLPGRGVHVASGGGHSGKCSSTFPKRVPPGATESCEGNRTLAPRVIMVLKSPLGDLRNKQFSDTASPYYFPGHQEADDTITFNQWRRGGFGAQEQFSWRRNDRALFGLLSGDETLWLDGRSFSDFSSTNIWRYFRYEGTDGTQSLENIRYNRSVPGAIAGYGSWDYNDDGIQDTIKVPDCGVEGCSGIWGDSIAGGFSNQNAGNIGNFLGVGPFALAAGDTTEFIWFMGGASDTLQTNRLIAAATGAFFNNYAGASAYPTPTVTAEDVQLNSAWFRDSTANSQSAQIRIQIKMPPRAPDESMAAILTRLQQSDPVATNLRNLNPDLLTIVTGRMQQNLAQLLLFKSCDRGTSWTTDAACTSATASFRTRDQDGSDIGIGWRPRFTISVDSITGQLSTYVITDVVPSGREYLYAFVTKTRGLFDVRVRTKLTIDSLGNIVDEEFDNLENALGADIDTITSPLSPSGPHTVRVYAPISVPAGTMYAALDSARVQTPLTTNRVSLLATSASVDGVFRMRFGNRFVITRTLDTLTGAETSTIIRQSVYRAYGTSPTSVSPTGANGGAAASPAGPRLQSPGAGSSFHYVASADTFSANHGFTYSARTSGGQVVSSQRLSTTPLSTVGSVKTFLDTINFAGYVLGGSGADNDPYYLAIANNRSNFTTTGGSDSALNQSTSEFEGSPWFPGFTATVTGETLSPAPRLSVVLRGPEDTLNTGVVSSSGVGYVNVAKPANSAPNTLGLRQPTAQSRGGFYHIEWQDDSFGPGAPFTLGTNAQLQPVLDASLAARTVGTFADTSSALRAEILAGVDGLSSSRANIGVRQLVRARVPFIVTRGPGQPPLTLAMIQRHQPGDIADSLFRNSILLGTSGDTTRVSIPPDAWMPGDTLWAFEPLTVDSTATVGGATGVMIVRDTVVNGRAQSLPIKVMRTMLGLKFVMRCNSNVNPTRTTCNPIRLGTRGASGYLPYQNGWTSVVHLNRAFNQNSEIELTALPVRPGVMPLTKTDISRIQVVPNPYIVQSSFDQLSTGRAVIENRVRFVNVPAEGTVRIYTLSGQLVQQVSWTQSDLLASGNGSPHGDLPFNLRTREGLDLASGLYLFVMTAKGAQASMPCLNPETNQPLIDANTGKPQSCENVARGKFVVIR